MDDLLSLPIVKSVSDVKGVRQLYDKIEVHIRGLQTLGVESNRIEVYLSQSSSTSYQRIFC